MMRIQILYEDREKVILYKPAGLATQSAKVTQADAVSELKNYLKGGYVGVVHRLDQPVEGLLLFAKTPAAAKRYSGALQEGTLNKEYLAVCCGSPEGWRATGDADGAGNAGDETAAGSAFTRGHTLVEPAGGGYRLTTCLKKESGKGGAVAVATTAEDPEGKRCVLEIRALQHREDCTLLRVTLLTGRFHQIRAQLSDAGIPLLGDEKYGSPESRETSAKYGVRTVALCADRLTVPGKGGEPEREIEIKPNGTAFAIF